MCCEVWQGWISQLWLRVWGWGSAVGFSWLQVVFWLWKEIKLISDMNNARALEQSVITIDIHWSSQETWQHNSSSSNPNSLEASRDLVQEQHGNHEHQEESINCRIFQCCWRPAGPVRVEHAGSRAVRYKYKAARTLLLLQACIKLLEVPMFPGTSALQQA